MAELILHHYDGSLFSEKIRAILGFKGMTWHSVKIPPIMPRPLLMPLTGGYRRTPVMQIGADVYCDTHMITEVIDRWVPDPPLHPEGYGFAVRTLAEHADTHLFQVAVALCFQPQAVTAMMAQLSPEQAEAFSKDREQLAEGATGLERMPVDVAETYLHDALTRLETQLGEADWVCGPAMTLADFAVYHCLWLIDRNEVVAPLLRPYRRVREWMGAIAGLGHGSVVEASAEEAFAAGRDAEPQPLEVRSSALPEGIAVGDAVTVTPTDYGLIPVAGTLDYCTPHTCGVLREDPEAGRVRVHFPRAAFRIERA